MIYPAVMNLMPLIKGLVDGLQPYANANETAICFNCEATTVVVEYHPYHLLQSLSQLLCQVINLTPHQCEIYVRLRTCTKEQVIYLEVENTGINLIAVNQISNHNVYPFAAYPLSNGTLFRLVFPVGKAIRSSQQENKETHQRTNCRNFMLK